MQSIALYLVRQTIKEKKFTQEEALRYVLKTLTYELLQDRNSELYAESPEYVWAMLMDEEKGNIEKWVEY